MAKVFLDAGHGGHDPGAVGNGLREKDVVLDIVLRVGRILESHDILVEYSRTADIFVELMEIAKKANDSGADIFISVHANASRDGRARGIETYSCAGYSKALKLSKNVLNAIVENGDLYKCNRGAKHAAYTVLTHTNMDAALVECAFIDNPLDAHLLRTRQQEFADAIAVGIMRTLKVEHSIVTANDLKRAVEKGVRTSTAHDKMVDTVNSIMKPSSRGLGYDSGHWAYRDLEELNGFFSDKNVEGVSDSRLDDICTRGEMLRVVNLLHKAIQKSQRQ